MTGFEVYKKLNNYIAVKDEEGFNAFMVSLNEDEMKEYEVFMAGIFGMMERAKSV